jgi:enamine deaminase RidA (YjgF/YER057c/UK114 family)
MRQIIRTPDAPGSALFAQAIRVGLTVYVSGTTGIDPKTNQLAGPTIQDQTRQALVNCEMILRAAGADLNDVVEVGVLLASERSAPPREKSPRTVLSCSCSPHKTQFVRESRFTVQVPAIGRRGGHPRQRARLCRTS